LNGGKPDSLWLKPAKFPDDNLALPALQEPFGINI